MITNYNLFLDDVRIPTHVTWAAIPKNQHYSVVRNYKEFVDLITLRGLPKFVCYDHDLADCHYGDGLNGRGIDYDKYTEKTGYDCAKWLVNYCINKGVKHPPYIVHSLNPIGKKNIESYIESYNKTLAEKCSSCLADVSNTAFKVVNTKILCGTCVAELDNPSF